MKKLIQGSLQQGVLLNIIFVGLIIFSALFAVPNIPVEQYPNFNLGKVLISTSFPGATPEEVERLVTQEIEDSLRGMKDIEFVKSVSMPDQSSITVKFIDDTDYKALYNELRFRVMGIQNLLPTRNGEPLTPSFNEVDVDEFVPIVQVNLVSKDAEKPVDERTLLLLAKDLRLRLEMLQEVKKVVMVGDSPEQYIVSIDPAKLEKHRLTIQEVATAMRSAGQAPPSGALTTTVGERLIRIDNRFRSKQDLLDVAIKKFGNGNVLYLSDLIDDKETKIERIPGGIINTINGLETAACKVLKKPTANVLEAKESVIATVDQFLIDNSAYGVKAVYSLDLTDRLKDSLNVLASSLTLSVIFVMLLLFLFLGKRNKTLTFVGLALALAATVLVSLFENFWVELGAIGVFGLFVVITCRTAILTISGIVFSFLGSLLVFYLTGQSVNEMTLLGFVLVSGIVVDDAVVVVENIQRHREMGKNLKRAVIDGTVEVALPVFSATLTTMAAFLPLLMMTGAVGQFFALVPIAVCVALAISLIECLFFLPLHVVDLEKMLGQEEADREEEAHTVEDFINRPGMIGKLSKLYDSIVRFALAHPFVSIASTAVMFAFAIFIVIMPTLGMKPILKTKFFPDNTTVMQIYVKMPDGSSVQQTDAKVREISRYLINKGPGYINNVTGQAGMSVDLNYEPDFNSQYGFILTALPIKANQEFASEKLFIRDMREELSEVFEKDGVSIDVTAAKDGPPTGLPINIRVSGLEDKEIMRAVDDLLAWLNEESQEGQSLDGVIDTKHDRQLRSTILSFETKRRELANLELNEAQVQQFVADSLDGAYIADFRRLDDEIPVKLRYSRDFVQDPVDLLNIPIVDDAQGKRVLFGDVGKLEVNNVPASLNRWNFQRIVTITGNLREDALIDATTTMTRIQKWWKENRENYAGVVIAFGGESESTQKSYESLMFAFLLAVVLIYAILATQFQSYLQPVLIMSNIIFSFTGVILVMAAFGWAASSLPEGTVHPERAFLTMNGFMAIVGLTGLVINDAIVLVNFMNKRVQDGLPLREAVLMAGHQRMRPIMMTTLTTIAGLLPMAIGIPDFSIAWSPFATAFIAGLTVSTTMTLVIIPVLFELLERIRRVKSWKAVFMKLYRKVFKRNVGRTTSLEEGGV